jgi:hypothetical protein
LKENKKISKKKKGGAGGYPYICIKISMNSERVEADLKGHHQVTFVSLQERGQT